SVIVGERRPPLHPPRSRAQAASARAVRIPGTLMKPLGVGVVQGTEAAGSPPAASTQVVSPRQFEVVLLPVGADLDLERALGQVGVLRRDWPVLQPGQVAPLPGLRFAGGAA